MKTIDSNIDIQALITPEHLRRMAIIYVRQSSREAIGLIPNSPSPGDTAGQST